MSIQEPRYEAVTSSQSVIDDEAVTVAGSFGALFRQLSRNRWYIAGAAVGLTIVVLGFTLLQERTYTATASFMSQSGRGQSSSLGGLAAQFGIAVPGDAQGDSPQFYLDLITSRAILEPVVATRYVVADSQGGSRATSLLSVFKAKGDNLSQRTSYTIRKLREHLAGSIGKQTGVVNISITTPSAVLSKLVMDRILESVNSFNLGKRQSRASAERQFTEGRLASAKTDLLDAENRLQSFMQQNRVYNTAPRLSFEQDRLSREVQNRQQIVNVLAQAFEQAKIDEVRDTPVITILDAPETPAAPDSRGLLTKVIFSLFFGAALGALTAWGRESWRRSQSSATMNVPR